MPKFDDSTFYSELTNPSRLDLFGVLKDVSEALPASQTKWAYSQTILQFGPWAAKNKVVTATGNVTLTDADPMLVEIDPNGSDRDINLPAKGNDNHPFIIRHAGSANTLTIKLSGGSIVTTLAVGNIKIFTPSVSGDFGILTTAGTDLVSPLTGAEISITGAATATLSRMHVCSGSSNYTITLPAASGNAGKIMGFRFTNTGITTLDGNASETIDGVTTRAYRQNQSVFLLCDGANYFTISGVTAPRSVRTFADMMICSVAEATTVDAVQRYGFYKNQSSPADGQTWDIGVFLTAGIYTVVALGFTGSSACKLDWTLNGVSQTTGQDWYSGTTVNNVEKTFTLTVPYTGYHVLRATINGKNASSGNYYWHHTKITILPSAY